MEERKKLERDLSDARKKLAMGGGASSGNGAAAGIREAGGIPFEFPVHPIQETGKRPTASLDRNLSYLSLVEVRTRSVSLETTRRTARTSPPARGPSLR